MAIFAVVTDVLRDTILHAIRLFRVEGASAEMVPEISGVAAAAYWFVFFLVLGAALYCAMLDLRYIRMLYAVEKREIFGRTLGDKEFREALLKNANEDPDAPPSA
jgi:hypothetical protein